MDSKVSVCSWLDPLLWAEGGEGWELGGGAWGWELGGRWLGFGRMWEDMKEAAHFIASGKQSREWEMKGLRWGTFSGHAFNSLLPPSRD